MESEPEIDGHCQSNQREPQDQLNVGDRVLFDFDKATLRPGAAVILDKQAAWFARYRQITWCSASGARTPRADRIATISYGKDRPVALGSDETAWAQNRNAVTSVQ